MRSLPAERNNGLLLHDADGNHRFTTEEDIWLDLDNTGEYNANGGDRVVWNGGGEAADTPVVEHAPAVPLDVVFTDKDGSEGWTPGEPVWENAATTDVPLARTGLFVDDMNGNGNGAWDAGENVWRNDPDLDGAAGLGGILHYADANGNKQWDAGEAIWAEGSATPGAASLAWSDSRTRTAGETADRYGRSDPATRVSGNFRLPGVGRPARLRPVGGQPNPHSG